MKTVKFAQVLKFSENLVKVDKPEEERYVTVLLYGRGVIEREIKEGKVPVAFTGYKAHAGQLIISTINARNGAAGIIPAELDGAVVSKDFPLFDIDHECVDEQYLLYYLWSDSFIHKAEQNSFGATMPRLHVKPFLNMQMRLPALSEQKRRAHTLCHVESLLNTQSHLLTKLDELVKSRFVEMFGLPGTDVHGWGMSSLGEICEINPKKSQDARLTNGLLVSFVPMPSVSESGDIDATQVKPYDEVKTGFTYFAENDVLFAKITPCMENGKGAIATGLYNGIGFGSTEFHVLRPAKETATPRWIYTLTVFPQFRIDAASNMTGSAGQRRVPASFLENYRVSVPPLELQNRFAAFVTEVDKSKLAVKQSLEKLETLKKSLMQQYFG